MIVIHSDRHRLRDARGELFGGEFVHPHERPERVYLILARLAERGFRDIREPEAHGLDPVLRVHDRDFVDFLASCWEDWQAAGYRGEAIATCWPSRRMPRTTPPREIDGRIGYYCLAAETSISPGTWEAAQAAADVALTGAALVSGGERAVFALCRPPGHHAARDMFGGFCFLNNAAIAAQSLRDRGADRVAILDVDFHHGNGTQSIFEDRADVLFASLHGDPMDTFPYYLGHADEVGTGAGEGFTLNYPMPPGTDYARWSGALDDAIGRIRAYRPDALVVSLGIDAYKGDPISFFRLEADDFTDIGRRIAALGLPTLFVMEGGYALEAIGACTVNTLEGFEGA